MELRYERRRRLHHQRMAHYVSDVVVASCVVARVEHDLATATAIETVLRICQS